MMSIGDVTSTERGSGARFNSGKPPMELIPLSVIADQWSLLPELEDLSAVMRGLGEFQAGKGAAVLMCAIIDLGEPWDDCARVLDYGKRKYASWNWAKGMPWSVPLACAARHLLAMRRGEVLDPESGLPHRGHVQCNIVMLATFVRTYPEGDDRPTEWLRT